MARVWTTADLEEWDERIRAKAEEFGLDCFTQEFEVCDQQQIRGYVEDPSIGLAKVEEILDGAHALSLQTRRHTVIRKLTPSEQREHALQAAEVPKDPYERIHKAKEYKAPDLTKVPLEPQEDV